MKNWLVFTLLLMVSLNINADPLPAEKVFHLQAQRIDPNTLVLNWKIKSGYFLYSDRIHLSETKNSNIHLGTIRFPLPQKKKDKLGRIFTVYRHKLAIPLSLLGQQPGETMIAIHYQGCSDDGFCYPPENKQLKLTINSSLELAAVELGNQVPVSSVVQTEYPISETEAVFFNHHWLMVILIFFGFGIFLAFTPCVLPMVPVLSGIIIGHSKSLSTRKAFLLSLSYVLSMSLTYALIGAVITVLGSNLQIAMQSPIVIGLFSLLFVVLALSMFGLYELQLPLSWQTKLGQLSRGQQSGHYIGAAAMGCLATLILSPCVTAPLIGALGYIAHTNNLFLGSTALFFLGLGMGTPLLLIGTSAGKWLPKTGNWMNTVKAFFGFMLLGVAIYLLQRIISGSIAMVLWSGLFVFASYYCGEFSKKLSSKNKYAKGASICLLSYGVLLLVGASTGGNSPLQPLASLQWANKKSAVHHTTVNSLADLEQAISIAKLNHKPILLDFYADWCASCQVMENTIFKDLRIKQALENFMVIKVDLTANQLQEKKLLNQFKVIAPPTFLFLDAEGKEQEHLRIVGETSVRQFLQQLKKKKAID